MEHLPTISVCMATLNAEGVLSECLKRLFEQDYPKDKIELSCYPGWIYDILVEKYQELIEKNSSQVTMICIDKKNEYNISQNIFLKDIESNEEIKNFYIKCVSLPNFLSYIFVSSTMFTVLLFST